MNGNYSCGFRVKPLPISAIRRSAIKLRDILIPGDSNFDLAEFIDNLERFGITVDVVPDSFLPRGTEASCIPEKRLIYIAESTYADACRNDERARFTIFHELGHLLLAHSRSFHRDATPSFPAYENSEWQADQFAAEILMPLHVITAKDLSTAWELQDEFGVSFRAATTRLKKLREKREIK